MAVCGRHFAPLSINLHCCAAQHNCLLAVGAGCGRYYGQDIPVAEGLLRRCLGRFYLLPRAGCGRYHGQDVHTCC